MNVRVMTKDIRGAKRNCWDNCPLKRALARSFPGNQFQVFAEHILVNGTALEHSTESASFVEEWDLGELPTHAQFVALPDRLDLYLI